MNFGRHDASSAFLTFEEWWITGGYIAVNTTATELLTSNGQSFQLYADLPLPMKEHVMVRVNETTVIFIGNCCESDNPEYKDLVFIFDKMSGRFANLPNLIYGRGWPMAGLVRHADGTNSVVVSGDPVQILDLDNISEGWIEGPDYYVKFSDSVAFRDTFLGVGGKDSTGRYSRNIHEYDPSSGTWKVRPEKLTIGRELAAAFLIPDEVARCD